MAKPSKNNVYKQLWLVQFVLSVLGLVYLQINSPLSINTDLSQLFQASSHDNDSQAVLDRYAKLNESQNLILIKHENLNQAIEDTAKLTKQFKQWPEIDSAISQFPQLTKIDTLIADYAPYQHSLLSSELSALLKQEKQNTLFQYQFNLLNQVANPFVAKSLSNDPTLSLADYLTKLPQVTKQLQQEQSGYLYSQDQQAYYILLRFQTKKSGLALNESAILVNKISHSLKRLESSYLATGQVFYAEHASQTAQYEMRLFSSISIIGITLLVFIAYRTVSALFATLAIIVISFFYGYLALSLCFEQVHILTFVFAITLVGIAVDYSFHALTDLAKQANQGKRELNLKQIKLPLFMGFASTATGYAILSLSPFIIFLQVSVFTLAGLAASLITVLVIFPYLIKAQKLKNNTVKHRFVERLNQAQLYYCQKKVAAVVILLSISCAITLYMTPPFDDDVRQFYHQAEHLKNQQQKIESLLGHQSEFLFILVKGQTPNEVLARESNLLKSLDALKQQQVISNYSAISQYLPSIQQQEYNQQLLEQGIKAGLMDDFLNLLSKNTNSITIIKNALHIDTWLKTSIGKAHQQQWFQQDDGYFSIIKIYSIKDLKALETQLAEVKNVKLIDNASLISEQLTQLKIKLAWLLAIASGLAVFVLLWVYGIKKSIIAVSIPMLAIIIALTISLFIQSHLGIFNILACVLIFALGLDYAVFYTDHGLVSNISFTTLISALSSMLVFAVLILSTTPAIYNFGLTVFIGIIATYLLSPFAGISTRTQYEQR